MKSCSAVKLLGDMATADRFSKKLIFGKMEYRSKNIFLVIVLILMGSLCHAQFTGTIRDALTEKTIANASISLVTSKGVTSWTNGYFEINIEEYPVTLTITHLSFHKREVIINSPVESGMNIFLEPKTVDLAEVAVYGKRLKRYYEKKNFYVVDFDFIDNNICLIGFENKQLNKGKVILINSIEDTLAYLNVNQPKRLYRDAYDNLHLITKDSIFQLFYNAPRFHQLFPTHQEEIPYEFFQMKFIEENKFLFKSISPRDQAHEYFVIDTLLKTTEILKKINSYEMAGARSITANMARPERRIPGRAGGELSISMMESLRDVYEMYVYDISIISFPVHSQMFRVENGFVLIDMVNNQINHYTSAFEPVKTVRSRLPKHKIRQKIVIQDSKTGKIYWIYYKGSKVLLGEIDLNSGQIVHNLETPSMPFIENVKIRNGTIWFTYQPRLGETVRSLFRMI